jgi:2-succinyl-6-hydroxy-2,4-cyclohexadiene-1-carboxylate synthase
LKAMPETLVLLHGFGGTHRAWDPLLPELDQERYNPIVGDLRGHGTKSAVRPVSFDGCVADVLAAAPDRFVLCGYSMGGRIAQLVALAAPERVARLVLVATGAGIEDAGARARRVAEDRALADEVEGLSAEAFADRWMAQPIFAGTPPQAAALWRADLLRSDPHGLAEALRTIGGGAMEPIWDRLPELAMPVTIVAGARDEKFARWATEKYPSLIEHADVHVLPGVGHGIPREAPRALAAIIQGDDA